MHQYFSMTLLVTHTSRNVIDKHYITSIFYMCMYTADLVSMYGQWHFHYGSELVNFYALHLSPSFKTISNNHLYHTTSLQTNEIEALTEDKGCF